MTEGSLCTGWGSGGNRGGRRLSVQVPQDLSRDRVGGVYNVSRDPYSFLPVSNPFWSAVKELVGVGHVAPINIGTTSRVFSSERGRRADTPEALLEYHGEGTW